MACAGGSHQLEVAPILPWSMITLPLQRGELAPATRGTKTTLETTQGQNDGFYRKLPYKCQQKRVASVGD